MAPRTTKVQDDIDAPSVASDDTPSLNADDADTGTARTDRDGLKSRDAGRSRTAHADTREETFERPDDVVETWLPPAPLDAPPPRPGMEQRWIRAETGNTVDRMNLSRAKREGFRPRDPSTVSGEWKPPMEKHGDQEVIQVEGMVLMERSERVGAQRDKHFTDLRDQQSTAINDTISRYGDDAGVKIKVKRQSTVQTGRQAVNEMND